MYWLRVLHLYVGLGLALFLLILAVSGGILVYKEDLWRLRYAELAESLTPADASAHAEAFAAIERNFPGKPIRQIKLPRPHLAAYHVYLHDGEAFVSQDGQRIIHQWRWYTDPLGLLTELHINLAAGRGGRIAAGVIGLLTAGLAIAGFALWLPLRHRLGLSSFLPRDVRRASLLQLHRDLGALAAVFIVLFSLTGAGVVFYGASRALFNGLLGDAPEDISPPRVSAALPPGMASTRIVQRAQEAVPGAALMSYYPPQAGSAIHYFRLRQAGEIHPNGRSMAYLEGNAGELIAAVDATRQQPGERVAQWLYPLHAGKVGSESYRLLAVAAALALGALAATGPLTWLQMRRRRAANRSRRPVPEGGRSSAP